MLYFAFVQTWHELAGENAYLIGRLFQDAIFLVGALTIFLLTRRAFGDAAGRRTALFYLLMPMSIYTASLTPDTLVQAMFYIVALVFGMGWPLRPIATAICLGLVAGAAYLIKPTALGCVPAILVAMSLSPLLPFAPRVAWYRAIWAIVVFAVATVASLALLHVLVLWPWPVLLLALLMSGALVGILLNLPSAVWQRVLSRVRRGRIILAVASVGTPLVIWLLVTASSGNSPGALVGRTYALSMVVMFSPAFWSAHLLGTIRYFGANIAALGAIFPCAFVLSGRYIWRAFRHEVDEHAEARLSLVVFAACATFFMVLMTSIATEVYSSQPFEADRFEARYYIFLLPLLIALLFGLGTYVSARAARICAGLGLVSVCCYVYLISTTFKVFAGDFPEAYAFFSVPNHLQWDYPKPWPLLLDHGGYICLAGGILAALAVFARPRLLLPAYGAYLLVIALMGQAEVNAYMAGQSDIIRWRAEDARAIAHLLGPVHPGDGVIVANSRYEFAPVFAFALRAPQSVVVRPSGAHLTETNFPPEAAWIATIDDYVADFHYLYSLRFEHTTLYVTRQHAPLKHEPEKPLWDGSEPLQLSFAAGEDDATLMGFNPPEEWGAWSETDVATITLPELVAGEITLKLNAGALRENMQQPLRLRVGDAHAELLLTEAVTPYELRLALDWPTDTIRLEMPTVRPAPRDLRSLGVALSRIEISRP